MGASQIAPAKRHVAFRLKFSSRALREIGDAYTWYESQVPGLGEEFLTVVELQLKRFEQSPFLYSEAISGVRRALLPRFPYGMFFAVRHDLVHVLAVIHNARSPRRWPKKRTR